MTHPEVVVVGAVDAVPVVEVVAPAGALLAGGGLAVVDLAIGLGGLVGGDVGEGAGRGVNELEVAVADRLGLVLVLDHEVQVAEALVGWVGHDQGDGLLGLGDDEPGGVGSHVSDGGGGAGCLAIGQNVGVEEVPPDGSTLTAPAVSVVS